MKNKTRVLVVGAACPLGLSIVRRLVDQNHSVTATYRTPRPNLINRLRHLGASPVPLDLRDIPGLQLQLAAADIVIFIPILTESANSASLLKTHQQAVFFSSNNVAIDTDDTLYQSILQSEEKVRKASPHATILRPTMIYGHPTDRNFSRLLRLLRRTPILPYPATKAVQQPVFFDDLADVAVNASLEPEFSGRTIAVAGPELLSYRQIIQSIAKSSRLRRLALPVPLGWMILFASAIQRVGLSSPFSTKQIRRAVFDKHARGDDVIVTQTPLKTGLNALVKATQQ